MKLKCVICNKEKKKWYICETCSEVLKRKYPNPGDFKRIIEQHKKELFKDLLSKLQLF